MLGNFLGFWVGCFVLIGLGAVAPAPLTDYCPVVIVNKTGQPSEDVYLVLTALDSNGIPCFLTPAEGNGICTYQYPNGDGSNGSAANSVTLNNLPVATGTGITGEAFLFYMPINTSGRAYFSIQKPVYLGTTYSPARGMIAINSPSVISLNDPNYYTLYQDFEFGLGESQVNSSTDIFINLSWVDYFCLPMKLYANSYQGNGADPMIVNGVAGPSGFPSASVQTSIMQTTMSSSNLGKYPTTWGYLPVSYYANPYTSTTSSGYIRILAAKNSTDLGTGRLFSGGPVTYTNYFPQNYLTNTATGPTSGVSYMETVYNYYPQTAQATNSLWAIITPASGYILYNVYSSTTAGTLQFDAYEWPVSGSLVPISADNTTLDLSTVPLDAFLSGGMTFLNNDFGNDTPIGAELGKLISTLFSIGQLPTINIPTSYTSPFYNAADVVIDQQNYGYVNVVYFPTPPLYSNGPWYNLYDQVLHNQMAGAGAHTLNPSLGVGYAYDYDDLLSISGIINGMTVQDQYGNPVSTPVSASSPYIVMELESLVGTTIPDLNDPYYYNVVVGPAPNGAEVEFIYNGGTTTALPGGNQTAFAIYGQTPITGGSDDYLHVTFTFNSVTYTYNVNLLGQIVTPLAGGTYSAADVQYQGNFTFTVTGGGNGSSSGAAIDITIGFNSSPPPWSG